MIELISNLLIISGLAAALALMIEIAKRYLADYGEVSIDLNQGDKQLSVTGGNTLLFQPVDEGFFRKTFYVLGVRHQGARIRLSGRLLSLNLGSDFINIC